MEVSESAGVFQAKLSFGLGFRKTRASREFKPSEGRMRVKPNESYSVKFYLFQ